MTKIELTSHETHITLLIMKSTFALLIFLSLTAFVRAETGMEVCDTLDNRGVCQSRKTEFEWPGDKLSLHILVENRENIESGKLKYRVFNMKNDVEGELYAELSLYTQPNWSKAYKKIWFIRPGYYKIEVYTESNRLLASGYVSVLDDLNR